MEDGRQEISAEALAADLINKIENCSLQELARIGNAIWPESKFRVEVDGTITELP